MPGGVLVGNAGDLLKVTLAKMPKGNWTETLKYQSYPLGQLFYQNAKVEIDGGTSLETRVRVAAGGGFRLIGLFEVTPTVVTDAMVVLTNPWIFWQDKMAFDSKEKAMNSGPAKVVDLLDTRRSATYEGIFNAIEEMIPFGPRSASDDKPFYGLDYHFATLGSGVEDPIGGFNGTLPYYQDGTQAALYMGQDPTLAENERLRNYNFTHTGSLTRTTLRQTRRALKRTSFGTLPQLKGQTLRSGGRQALLWSQDFDDQYEELLESTPDDKGNDLLGARGGKVRGVETMAIPVFDSISYSPIYGVRTKNIYGCILQGRWMKESEPMNSQGAPDVYVIAISGTGLLNCDNRREAGFVGHSVR